VVVKKNESEDSASDDDEKGEKEVSDVYASMNFFML